MRKAWVFFLFREVKKVLVEGQKVEVIWSGRTKNYYIDKGYEFTGWKEPFYVDPHDLPPKSHKRVKVVCDYCSKEYTMTWDDYLRRVGEKCSCHRCGRKKRAENNLAERQAYLHDRAKKSCDLKGYKLISKKEEIKDSHSVVSYECPKHGVHQMSLTNLVRGRGCPRCKGEIIQEYRRLTPNEISQRVKNCHGHLLNIDEYIDCETKNLLITCPLCGEPFITSLRAFCEYGGQPCPDCVSRESSGEKKIRLFLEKNRIDYRQEHRFSDCKDYTTLPFDFYLPENHMIIEYDGEHHFHPVSHWGGNDHFKKTQKHDKMKNKYCHDHDIKLIRIPYTNFNHIEEILDKELEPYVKDIV